jgi:hypothetical protein
VARRHTYGRQAQRQTGYAPYVVSFLLMIAALGAFLYVGLNWATGSGRVAGLGTASVLTPTIPTPSPIPSPSVIAVASPSPTPRTEVYVVRPGDNPASIADQFNVSLDALMQANNITDPRSLQVGQRLTIPPPRN